jgi:hypothetical protein
MSLTPLPAQGEIEQFHSAETGNRRHQGRCRLLERGCLERAPVGLRCVKPSRRESA